MVGRGPPKVDKFGVNRKSVCELMIFSVCTDKNWCGLITKNIESPRLHNLKHIPQTYKLMQCGVNQ